MLAKFWGYVYLVNPGWRDVLRHAREHEEVLQAVRSGDAQAAQAAMRHHIISGRERTLAAYDRHQQHLALENGRQPKGGMLRMDFAEKNKKRPTTLSGLTVTGLTTETVGGKPEGEH